jgi:hypothetical protein
MNIVVVATALAVGSILAFSPVVRGSRAWRATVTPLSSIMGSGFLVAAPLVASVAGVWAPAAMAALLAVAYGIGAMMRFNIRHAERMFRERSPSSEHRLHRGHRDGTHHFWTPTERRLTISIEKLSHVVLAAAYVVSVSYYLQLLSAFVLERFGIHDPLWSRAGTTGVLAVITFIGATRGLKALERLETYAVSLNLGTIAALLVGLGLHVVLLAQDGELSLPTVARDGDSMHSARVMMGLLIVVQGFETSRFLGAEHPAEERARTMRFAQIIAAAIYLLFVTLMLPLLGGRLEPDVTAIVTLVTPVTAVLPFLLVIAAVGSQFSASVADDAGCAGLLGTILGDRVSSRWVYLAVGLLAVGLTWITDALSIISLASRAFALFYACQCAVTAAIAYQHGRTAHRGLYLVGGVVFMLISLAVTCFGIPAE